MGKSSVSTRELPVLIAVKDRSDASLLSDDLRELGFKTAVTGSMSELDRAINSDSQFAIGVIDLSGFDDSIWERCDSLRRKKTPCIIITPHRSPTARRESITHGVDALLVHPVTIKEIIQHIQTTLGG